MKKLLLILLCLPFLIFSQCEEDCEEKKEYKNAIYRGCLNSNNSPHGKGSLEFKNGDSYIGCWKDGKQNGKGVYYYNDGTVWIGIWNEGERLNGHYEHENFYNPDHLTGNQNHSTIYLDKIVDEDGAGCLQIPLSFNGIHQEFLFDTGCSGMLISSEFLERIKSDGVKIKELISGHATTATNDMITTKKVIIYDVVVGDYIIKELVVSVIDNGAFLCGMGLLKKFSNVKLDLQTTSLKLYK
tara:strand:- start:85 stop:807 length:723 start_codon:yes stop_codon:yes gene_type:complete